MNSEVRSSPGLNMEHGFIKKIEQHQYNRQYQAQSDHARKQESAKLARKVGLTNKTAKPTRQIYQPPSMRTSSPAEDFGSLQVPPQQGAVQNEHDHLLMSNGNRNSKVTFNLDSSKQAVELKSALKRSKSFGGADQLDTSLHDWDGLPREYEALVKKALDNPNNLSSRQLMEVVRVLCNKAVESKQAADQIAHMCFTIIQKEKGETFLESLMNSCREWFNERDKLLPRFSGSPPGGGQWRRWTSFVAFLTELYLSIKSRHHQLIVASETTTGPSYTLLTLIYESCQIILSTVHMNNVAEIECLHTVLMSVGRSLEVECPQRMQQLVSMIRDAFMVPTVTAQVRKTLLELVELHASQWKMDLRQSMYYYPYTSMDRKGL